MRRRWRRSSCRQSGPLLLQPLRDELEHVDRAHLLLHALCPDAYLQHDQAERAPAGDLRGPGFGRQELVDPAVIDALTDLLLHPPAATARAAAEPAFAVVRRDLRALYAGKRGEDRPGLVVDAVVTAEVARVVVGDDLLAVAGNREPPLGQEPVDELQRMENFIGAAQLRIFVGDGVEAMRTARDHLLHAVLREGLDVLLRLQLPEVLVADPARGIAVAGLLGTEDGE